MPATVLEALGLGRHQLRYVLIDRAGNVSGLSNGFNLEVQLQPVPSNLLPPIVVAAINRSHFNPSGTSLPVGIPVYTGALATDQIVLSLHDDASPPTSLIQSHCPHLIRTWIPIRSRFLGHSFPGLMRALFSKALGAISFDVMALIILWLQHSLRQRFPISTYVSSGRSTRTILIP